MRQAAACECGQVLFDIVERKSGDDLTCPWCNREYRYLGDGIVERKDKKPVSAITQDTYRDWKNRAKNAKVSKLPETARANGKPAFERHQFEAPKLEEQGFETTSMAADIDKDGNAYVVVVCLSANTREAFKSAEAAYLSILKAY